jgi:hypothetical protein
LESLAHDPGAAPDLALEADVEREPSKPEAAPVVVVVLVENANGRAGSRPAPAAPAPRAQRLESRFEPDRGRDVAGTVRARGAGEPHPGEKRRMDGRAGRNLGGNFSVGRIQSLVW